MTKLKMIYREAVGDEPATNKTRVVLESEDALSLDELLPAITNFLRGAGYRIEGLKAVH